MNRVTRRILASKSYSQYKSVANNAYTTFKADVGMTYDKFTKLFDLLDGNDYTKIDRHLADMISDLDSFSTNLVILQKNIRAGKNE